MTALPRDGAEGCRTVRACHAVEARKEPPQWGKSVAGRERAWRGWRWEVDFRFPPGQVRSRRPGICGHATRESGSGLGSAERETLPVHGYGIREVTGHGQERMAG